ncbi:MAG: 5-oxoprolinase subunit B family protein [Jhaorihella sp.]
MAPPPPEPCFPAIRTAGLNGMLVRFADRMSEPANRAALAFRVALEGSAPEGVEETASSLVSVLVRFDPARLGHDALRACLGGLLDSRDWYGAPLPPGRRLWRIPTIFGTDLAPQLDEAAAEAGLSPEQAIQELGAVRVRVLTIGFAPGQPYLGPLGPQWDLARQTRLTARVPEGALVLAVRQFTLFAAPAPTGWRHVGQTAFRCFRRGGARPFSLAPGDEVRFEPAEPADYDRLREDAAGGAVCEEIA